MSLDTQILQVFQSVFGDTIAALNDGDAIGGLPGWDSAGQLNLIMAIEAEFDVQFDIEEMETLTTVAAIRERLDKI